MHMAEAYHCCTHLLYSQSLEQEKFSLQQKLEVQKSTADAIQHDFDNTCAQLDTLEQKYSQQLKYAEEVHSQKLHEQTKIVNDLKAEIEKLEVSTFVISTTLYTQIYTSIMFSGIPPPPPPQHTHTHTLPIQLVLSKPTAL